MKFRHTSPRSCMFTLLATCRCRNLGLSYAHHHLLSYHVQSLVLLYHDHAGRWQIGYVDSHRRCPDQQVVILDQHPSRSRPQLQPPLRPRTLPTRYPSLVRPARLQDHRHEGWAILPHCRESARTVMRQGKSSLLLRPRFGESCT